MTERRVFDVDIDTNSRTKRENYGVRAMVYNDKVEKVLPHPSGVYLEPVPVDPETGNCAFDYEYGNDEGFMKVDILSNSAYDRFKSKAELLECLEEEPDWDLLLDRDVTKNLPHISKYHELLIQLRPRSIEDLADFLAIIRPAKLKYVGKYKKNKDRVRKQLYLRPTDGTAYFKRSHAISYAMMIVSILNHQKIKTAIQW